MSPTMGGGLLWERKLGLQGEEPELKSRVHHSLVLWDQASFFPSPCLGFWSVKWKSDGCLPRPRVVAGQRTGLGICDSSLYLCGFHMVVLGRWANLSQWTAYLKHKRCLDSHLFPHPCLVHILSTALIVFGPNARSTKIYWCNISNTFIHSHSFIFIKRENTDISGHSVDADAWEDIFKELFFESVKPCDDLRFRSN